MSYSQRAESNHSFVKKYLDRCNSLMDLVTRFNRALAKQRYGELQADHVDHQQRPMLRTPIAFERQMAEIYTHSMFKNFQCELWECMNYGSTIKIDDEFQTIYEVERHVFDDGNSSQRENENGEQIPDRVRLVVDDKVSDVSRYNCKNFEWEGIPCRHLLHIFVCRKQLVELLGKYIMMRWTKGAKCRRLMEDSGVNMEDAGDRGMLLFRNELYGIVGRVVDGVVFSVEDTELLKEDLLLFEQKMKSLSIGDCSNNLRTTSICPPISSTPMLLQPNQVRSKGCGKRLTGGKKKTREQNLRKCNGCGQWGQSHVKKNCPALMDIPAPSNTVRTIHSRGPISNDDVVSSTGKVHKYVMETMGDKLQQWIGMAMGWVGCGSELSHTRPRL
ncbi:hypothetical protein L1049_022898 [Liquidambar formosana]|uniref:Protein FAR1-RELATED SEQUENCE n=1 Tax=Liquidambar formosana TaxID=63359 RepID=A0AAP0RD85_LIQFO